MHIEFKKLILHNFMSFGDSQLLFEDDGFIKVSGINQNPSDSATSNGSGKSSIWEAVIWALTGDTIRGTKQVTNLYGTDGTYVDLEFYIDKKAYQIIRSKDHKEYKTGLKIIIDGKDCSGKGIRESEKLLVQYLPDINASLLGSVIILGQGLPQKFTNNTPSGRKEVLEKLSKSDFMIEDLKGRVIKRKSELTTVLRTHQDNIIALDSKKAILLRQVEQATTSLNNINKTLLEETVNDLLLEEQRLKDELENQLLITLAQTQDEILHINEEITSRTNNYVNKLQELDNFFQPKLQKQSQLRIELNSKITGLQKQITSIQNIKDTCPTCGQKLQGVEKPDPTSLIIELEGLKVELTQINNSYQTINDEYQTEKLKFNKEHDLACKDLNDRLAVLKREYSALGLEKDSYEKDLKTIHTKYQAALNELTSLESTIANLHKMIADNTQEIATIESQYLYNINERDAQQARLDVINKFDIALKRDFRGFLLTTIIDYIQERAKEYAKVIFETDLISFGLDGNNIDISYMNKAYENLSGGEKQKIDLIIQFSIRDMLCNHLNFTSNILVLDEVFDGLDMIGCQRVLDVISAISDIKNIFIVTHRKDLSIPSDRELIVVKSPTGISEIR